MAKKPDLVAKWGVVEYSDGTLDTPRLQKFIEDGLIEMTPQDSKWDLRTYYRGYGWASGNVLAIAGNFFRQIKLKVFHI